MGKRLTAEEAARIEHAPVVRGSWIYCAKCSASLTEDSPPCTIRSDEEVDALAHTIAILEADLAALRIEREAHAALLSITRRDRDEARADRDRLLAREDEREARERAAFVAGAEAMKSAVIRKGTSRCIAAHGRGSEALAVFVRLVESDIDAADLTAKATP
jgi:hypothetical protein